MEMWLLLNHIFVKYYFLPLDVDECTMKEQNCDENANCENIPAGSYTCTCQEGFHGDGKICTDDYAKIKNDFVHFFLLIPNNGIRIFIIQNLVVYRVVANR